MQKDGVLQKIQREVIMVNLTRWKIEDWDRKSVWMMKGHETFIADKRELDPVIDLFFESLLIAGKIKKVNKVRK